MFSYSKLRRATESTVKSVDEVSVYCICRMPELPNTCWIQYSGCKRWYHTESYMVLQQITAQLVYVYLSWSCSLSTDTILKFLTNLLAITIPKFSRQDCFGWMLLGRPKFSEQDQFYQKIWSGGPFFSAESLVPGPIFPGPNFQ